MVYYAKMKINQQSKRGLCFVVALLACVNGVLAQRIEFGKPMNIPLELSASFAELRLNAFHAGLDFRTQQREGLPVYAVADGTLSRVVVSPVGFGKALYITHANGMMSVYAHLSRFVPAIERVVREQQYAKLSFAVDFSYPQSLQFKKGDLIGYSGNTGSSGGPHLHFELRNSAGTPVNPWLWGYTVEDNIPPTIFTFAIYPQDRASMVNGQRTPLMLPVTCRGVNCSLRQDTIRVFGNFAFGIEATDKANASNHILGLYTKKVFIDDELRFAWRLHEIPFTHVRFVNAFVDYAHHDSTGQRIQWTRVLPGNRLNVYEKKDNRGVYAFLENGTHNLRVEAADAAGNTTVLNVVLLVDDQMELTEADAETPEQPQGRLFSHAVSNTFETDDIKVTIPSMALYEPIHFRYSVEPSSDPRIFSNIHHVHHSGTPVHVNYSLRIKPTNLPQNLRNKALIGSWDARRNRWVAEGGRFSDGFVTHNLRKFSIFAVCIDTVSPTIKPIDVINNSVPATQNTLTFEIDDEFSGINEYTATINGRWFLMEYDPKTKTLRGVIDTELPRGEHIFNLNVSDRKNNRTTYGATIIR